MSERPESARHAVARWAKVSPEEPFLFFRSSRGTFTWWSFARTASAFERGSPDADVDSEPVDRSAVDPVPNEIVGCLAAVEEAELRRASNLVATAARATEREIWVSTRPLERREERALALAAALGRWALVREPGERLHPGLFLWARPTLVSGSALELAELLAGVLGEAPRRGRARWLARRLSRLAVVLVEGGGSVAEVAAGLAGLGVAPRVLPFPGSGW